MNRPIVDNAAPRPVIIDTDPGIDDAMAILGAFADPALEIRGLTTVFGNVPLATATRNTLQLVELAARSVPVAAGAALPLRRPPAPHPEIVHGTDGFGGVQLPEPAIAPDTRTAPVFLAEETRAARAAHSPLTIVALGPLTNLALALEASPAIVEDVAGVIVMGGAVRHPGNVTDEAEANFWQDPHAAALVLAAPWPVTLIGLDVTECARLYPEDLAALPPGRCTAFLARAARHYAAFHLDTRGFHGCYLHDPTAAAAAADPALLETRRLPLAVTLEGAAEGMVREAPGSDEVEVAIAANAPGIRARLLGGLAAGRLP
ncbi:MAG: nucleoside hydrolase [Pseudomonadota bacterium]